MALPPFDAGAAHDTVDDAFAPEVAVTAVGAPGVLAGVAVVSELDGDLFPDLLIATTVNFCAVPLVRPDNVHQVFVVLQVAPPREAVTR